MQHTLLPASERKALRSEYRKRALIVLFFTLSVAGIAGIGSLFPAFFAASQEQHAAENNLQLIKKAKDLSGLTSIQQKVASGIGLISILDESKAQPHLSLLLSEIVSDRGAVKITSLDVNYTSTTTAQAIVHGVAPTRESLIAFKTHLEADQPAMKVDLPVSELAKGSDVPFSVQVSISFK